MKKFVLIITIMLSLISVSAYAMKEQVVKPEKVSAIINECYPGLKDYYEAGVLSIESLTEQTLGDGSTEYDIRYKFIKNYYEGEELTKVLKEQYPDLYAMNQAGLVKDVSIYKFVDKNTGKILNYVAYNRGERNQRPRPMPWFGRMSR